MARRAPGAEIVIKAKDDARALAALRASFGAGFTPPANLSIVSGGDPFALITTADVVIGFNSTALFEALAAAVPVIVPELDLDAPTLDPDEISATIVAALTRLDLKDAESPVALGYRWRGSASFQRLDQFGHGVRAALRASLENGQPLVLVGDGDIGGLVGLHLKEEMGLEAPVISVDGIELREFDYVDIGDLIPSSGAVPVVIKSLIFPASAEG